MSNQYMSTPDDLSEAVKAILEQSAEDRVEAEKTREAPKAVEWDDPLLRNETVELTAEQAEELVEYILDELVNLCEISGTHYSSYKEAEKAIKDHKNSYPDHKFKVYQVAKGNKVTWQVIQTNRMKGEEVELDEANANAIPRRTVLKGVPRSRELKGPLKTTAIHTDKARKFLVLPSTRTTTVQKEPRLFGRKTSTTTNKLGRSAFKDRESQLGSTVDGMHTARARTMLGTPSKTSIVTRPEPVPLKQKVATAAQHVLRPERPEPAYHERVAKMKPDEKAAERKVNHERASGAWSEYHGALSKGDKSAAAGHLADFHHHLNRLRFTSGASNAETLHSTAKAVASSHERAHDVAKAGETDKALETKRQSGKIYGAKKWVRKWSEKGRAKNTADLRNIGRAKNDMERGQDKVASNNTKVSNALSRLAAESLQHFKDRE